MEHVTEGTWAASDRKARRARRTEFARVLRMVNAAQREEDMNHGAHGPALVSFVFEKGSDDALAVNGARGYRWFARLSVIDHDDGSVEVRRA